MRRASAWTGLAEVGSRWTMRAVHLFYRICGRRWTRLLLHPAAAWFHTFHPDIREASLGYLRALYEFPGGAVALGRAPDRRAVHRHLHEFAIQLFDRMVVWDQSLRAMTIDPEGGRPLLDRARAGRGGILVGAHLGSFDMLRRISDHYAVTVNVLMYTRHAEQINDFFQKLDPRSRVRVVSVDSDFVSTAFVIRRCIERGEFVGILADRLHAGGRERPARASFLGRPTAFPATPFEAAATLGCPLLLCLCVRTGDARYASLAKPLFDGPPVPRGERRKVVDEMVQAYAHGLEETCLRAPYQWFNFFDFWA